MSAKIEGRDGDSSPKPGLNLLLSALEPDDLALISSRLETVSFEQGAVLYRPGEQIHLVYFPRNCVVSVVNRMENGGGVEVGTVGREGMVGLAAFLGNGNLPNETLVQVAGDADVLPAELLLEVTEAHPSFRHRLNKYVLAFLAQVSQTASCNRAHTIEQRSARWLLMTADRVGSNDFKLTHQFLSFMLGVRRAGVTVALGGLQKAGLISYRRGAVRILDRARLQRTSCECYEIISKHYDQMA